MFLFGGVPRDKERIRPFLEKVAKEWEKCPDLRFGQLVSNLEAEFGNIFNWEEDEFAENLRKHMGRYGR